MYLEIVQDYGKLLELRVSSTSNGITYGITDVYNVGPGFVSFCADKGVTVSQNTVDNPNYRFFTNCIDGGNMAVVHCGVMDER